jgi:hypothetical protein
MKKIGIYFITNVILLFMIKQTMNGQDLSNAGSYMSYIGEREKDVTKKYLNYISAASHGKSLRKVEKLREQVLNSIYETRISIQGTPPFQGDKTLREASVAYLMLCYRVFNEDYSKIVNMEEIAEQSYDAMEAYMLAQKMANDKLDEAAAKRNEVGKDFAKKFNVQIIEGSDVLDEKMKKSGRVTEYYNEIYLIFFKCYRQEAYLIEALNKNNMVALEQARNSLLKYATEGLAKLDTISAFDSDASLKASCQKALQFYKSEASEKIPVMTEFILKQESFEKLKKTFNSKSSSQRSQTDIDNYNKAVSDINQAGNDYNRINNETNKKRSDMLDTWNNVVKKYWDNHMPYAKG